MAIYIGNKQIAGSSENSLLRNGIWNIADSSYYALIGDPSNPNTAAKSHLQIVNTNGQSDLFEDGYNFNVIGSYGPGGYYNKSYMNMGYVEIQQNKYDDDINNDITFFIGGAGGDSKNFTKYLFENGTSYQGESHIHCTEKIGGKLTSSLITGQFINVVNAAFTMYPGIIYKYDLMASVQVTLEPNNAYWKFGGTAVLNTPGNTMGVTFYIKSGQIGSIKYADGYSSIGSGTAANTISYCIMFDGSSFLVNKQIYK